LCKNLHIIYNLITVVNITSYILAASPLLPINKYVKAKLELDNPNHNPGRLGVGGWQGGWMAFGLQTAKVLG